MSFLPYLIKTFRGGISDENDKGVAGAFKFGYNLDIHGRDDALMCGSTMAVVTPSGLNDMVKYFVPASDGSTYVFGNRGSIWARNGTTGEFAFAYNDENGEIKGAEEWKISDGNNYLFWATNTSLARVALNGSLAVPWGAGVATIDYKTTLDSADYHTMGLSSGVLAIANANALATLDYVGNFNAMALNVRPGNLIKCLEERDDYTVLGSYRADNAEEGHIWNWITVAQNWVQKKKVPVKGINALIAVELMLMQGGANGELLFSDFVNIVPLHGIPGGGKVEPSGVTIHDELAAFGMYGGDYPGIWTYGRKRKNRPTALNYQYRLTPTIGGSTIATIGAVCNINGALLASWGTNETDSGNTYSVYGIDQLSSTTKASAVYEGLEFDGKAPYSIKGYDTVKFTMAPLPSGCAVACRYKLDKSTTASLDPGNSLADGWIYARMGDGGTSFSVTGAVEAIFTLGARAAIYEIGTELTPSGSETPKILAVATYVANETNEY